VERGHVYGRLRAALSFATPLQPRNGKSRWKKLTSLSCTPNGMDSLDDSYTDNPFVDAYKTTEDEGHSQHFSKSIVLDLVIINFQNDCSHKNVL